MPHAYYCAKCKNEQTDPRDAERLAGILGLPLWLPKDKAGSFGFPDGALACRQAIDEADCVICQPPIGHDCAWELGYAAGAGKKIYVIGSLPEDDWMTKIDIHYVDPAALAPGFRQPRADSGPVGVPALVAQDRTADGGASRRRHALSGRAYTRVAAIDCGTNSIRLIVADLPSAEHGPDARMVEVVERFDIIRLGQDVGRTGRLAREAVGRARAVLADYAALITAFGVERVRMCATWVSRGAADGEEFLALVSDTLGLRSEVLSGGQEAHLAFAGVTRALTGGVEAPYLMADIGGGSTQFALGSSDAEHVVSADLGCVRIAEHCLRTDPPVPREIAAAELAIETGLDEALAALPGWQDATLIGASEAVTTVAAIAWARPFSSSGSRPGWLTYHEVDRVVTDLLGTTAAQRSRIPGMHPDMVDVIVASALVVRATMKHTGKETMVVSRHGLLHGIAWSLGDRPPHTASPAGAAIDDGKVRS
ncbi:Ppx/GppA phosphatase family protein [Streptomyces olivoreticuli]|uniref:Ppx/GppA phosphatase family protein n=1 Tax=Streptomyces olivoreticuli TaxID=68246 RepID=UPI001966E5BC|nr:exopolyphosphatase [Streptomyces olivoreticuli]